MAIIVFHFRSEPPIVSPVRVFSNNIRKNFRAINISVPMLYGLTVGDHIDIVLSTPTIDNKHVLPSKPETPVIHAVIQNAKILYIDTLNKMITVEVTLQQAERIILYRPGTSINIALRGKGAINDTYIITAPTQPVAPTVLHGTK